MSGAVSNLDHSINQEKNASKLSTEVEARRRSMHQGEICEVDALEAPMRFMSTINQLDIGRFGGVINFIWGRFHALNRTTKTDDLGRTRVWIDLKESRWDSNETIAKASNLSVRTVERYFAKAVELGLLITDAKQNKLDRNYAFSPLVIAYMTGAKSSLPRPSSKITKPKRTGKLCKNAVTEGIKNAVTAYLVLDSSEFKKEKEEEEVKRRRKASFRNPSPVGLSSPSLPKTFPSKKSKKQSNSIAPAQTEPAPEIKNGVDMPTYHDYIDSFGVPHNWEESERLEANKQKQKLEDAQTRARCVVPENVKNMIWERFDKLTGYDDNKVRSEALKRIYSLYKGSDKMNEFIHALRVIHLPKGYSYANIIIDEQNWVAFKDAFEKAMDGYRNPPVAQVVDDNDKKNFDSLIKKFGLKR